MNIDFEAIGRKAVTMHQTRRAVEKWMADQGALGNLVTAGQAPDWHDYAALQLEFQAMLSKAVDEPVRS